MAKGGRLMIDFSNLEQYRENNRIEAKRALGGLPESIWETYSAFANTLGGIILLGVEEHRDGSLHAIALPDPEWLAETFWEAVNDPQKASVNILSEQNVRIEDADGKPIVVITVPRAQRFDKPVYIDGNPMAGTYRRSGEGDYKCTREEVESMLRDAAIQTPDMKLLSQSPLEGLDLGTVRRYRLRMQAFAPGDTDGSPAEFLCRIGAAAQGGDRQLHPTAAGLLMFGRADGICREFPHYHLDYQEQDGGGGCVSRIVSSAGDWSGNLYDFYCQVSEKILQWPGLPDMGMENGGEAVYRALLEALANCLVNADYYGRGGICIRMYPSLASFSNPGVFRIGLREARSGGISDPRNAALVRMFQLVRIAERAGSGIPHIYAAWKKQGWAAPAITERFCPERTTLSLPIGKSSVPEGSLPGGGAAAGRLQKRLIIDYLTDRISATAGAIAAYTGQPAAQVQEALAELAAADIIACQGDGPDRRYQLKA